MAILINIDNKTELSKFLLNIRKQIQSVNINFIIGAGCSFPAINIAGNIEEEINLKIDNHRYEEAEIQIFNFIKDILKNSVELINEEETKNRKNYSTIKNYRKFFEILSEILIKRENNLLNKRINIFSTNYDLFCERAFELINPNICLNDGFRRFPAIKNSFEFSINEFSNSLLSNGKFYNYQVEIPIVNLIKLHGSMSWLTIDNIVSFSIKRLNKLLSDYEDIELNNEIEDIRKYNQEFSVILPTRDKFRNTVLDRTYYDLLRYYANELDKENTLLISEGFSFNDEHILEITRSALKNLTLEVIIFCYSRKDFNNGSKKFEQFNNVKLIYSKSKKITFSEFNNILGKIIP